MLEVYDNIEVTNIFIQKNASPKLKDLMVTLMVLEHYKIR
jgi:hypothetical protein